jgi:Ca2+-transporting ATPase
VLGRQPRQPHAQLLDRAFLQQTFLTGLLTAGVTLAAFAYELYVNSNLQQARDAAFMVLVMAELMRAFGARSNTLTIWHLGLFSNIRLFMIVLVSFSLQIAIHHIGVLQVLFGTAPITLQQTLIWIALGFVPLLVLEARKILRQPRASHA